MDKERFEKQMLINMLEKTVEENEKDSEKCEALAEWKEQLLFDYPHKSLEGLYTKTSVSELKMAHMHKVLRSSTRTCTSIRWLTTSSW